MNRELKLLSDVFFIMADIRATEEMRQFEKDRMCNITQHISAAPGGHGSAGGLEGAFARLSRLEEKHEKECAHYAKTLEKAEKALNRIKDRRIKTFVVLRYMLRMSDEDIKRELNMSRKELKSLREKVENAGSFEEIV